MAHLRVRLTRNALRDRLGLPVEATVVAAGMLDDGTIELVIDHPAIPAAAQDAETPTGELVYQSPFAGFRMHAPAPREARPS